MHIHTDGGCENNGQADARGAWAFVASDGHEESGVVHGTTNNRTELLAVIKAVEYAKAQGCRAVTIYTDSQLTQLCAIGRWKRKKNLDLWRDYAAAAQDIRVSINWVRGHSGIAGNERADELCSIAMADAGGDTPEVQHLRAILRGA